MKRVINNNNKAFKNSLTLSSVITVILANSTKPSTLYLSFYKFAPDCGAK